LIDGKARGALLVMMRGRGDMPVALRGTGGRRCGRPLA